MAALDKARPPSETTGWSSLTLASAAVLSGDDVLGRLEVKSMFSPPAHRSPPASRLGYCLCTPSHLLGKAGGTLQKFEYAELTDPTSFNEGIEKLLKR